MIKADVWSVSGQIKFVTHKRVIVKVSNVGYGDGMADFVCKRAVITGASSGLGEEFARQLAPYLEEAVLIARREDRLCLVREMMLRVNPEVKVTVLPGDLTDGGFIIQALDSIRGMSPKPTLLINNAGLGDYGDFLSADWSRVEAMLVLNMATLTKMTHALLPDLVQYGGSIINISSLASSLPIPDFAVYAASKSYVLSFSEALRLELKDAGVNVLAVCPGPVSTEFGKVARRQGFTGNMMPGRHFFDTPMEVVVTQSLRAAMAGRARIYPGAMTKAAALMLGILPSPLIRLVMGRRPRKVAPAADNNPAHND